MNQSFLERFVTSRRAEAHRLFGVDADETVLARYAREAALDLWITEPRLTLAAARQAEKRLRAAL